MQFRPRLDRTAMLCGSVPAIKSTGLIEKNGGLVLKICVEMRNVVRRARFERVIADAGQKIIGTKTPVQRGSAERKLGGKADAEAP